MPEFGRIGHGDSATGSGERPRPDAGRARGQRHRAVRRARSDPYGAVYSADRHTRGIPEGVPRCAARSCFAPQSSSPWVRWPWPAARRLTRCPRPPHPGRPLGRRRLPPTRLPRRLPSTQLYSTASGREPSPTGAARIPSRCGSSIAPMAGPAGIMSMPIRPTSPQSCARRSSRSTAPETTHSWRTNGSPSSLGSAWRRRSCFGRRPTARCWLSSTVTSTSRRAAPGPSAEPRPTPARLPNRCPPRSRGSGHRRPFSTLAGRRRSSPPMAMDPCGSRSTRERSFDWTRRQVGSWPVPRSAIPGPSSCTSIPMRSRLRMTARGSHRRQRTRWS